MAAGSGRQRKARAGSGPIWFFDLESGILDFKKKKTKGASHDSGSPARAAKGRRKAKGRILPGSPCLPGPKEFFELEFARRRKETEQANQQLELVF